MIVFTYDQRNGLRSPLLMASCLLGLLLCIIFSIINIREYLSDKNRKNKTEEAGIRNKHTKQTDHLTNTTGIDRNIQTHPKLLQNRPEHSSLTGDRSDLTEDPN